jgi:DNA-binding NarL/FixJ family response regulator
VLGAHADLAVLTVTEPARLIDLALHHDADILLTDLSPSCAAGVALTRELTRRCPGCKVIVMSVSPIGLDLLELIDAGAAGLLLTDANVDDVVHTIRTVNGGAMVLPHVLAGRLGSLVAERTGAMPSLLSEVERVTTREQQIMMLVADGFTNMEIAARLNVAPFTVKSHVHNILGKLGLRTRGQIARRFPPDRLAALTATADEAFMPTHQRVALASDAARTHERPRDMPLHVLGTPRRTPASRD